MTTSATSCELSADRAGYWVPVLLSPLGVPATVLRINNYYRSSGVPVRAFPPNLRIITGGDTLNPQQGGPGGVNVSYSCMRTGPFVPVPGDCTGISNKLIAHVRFPNCLLEGATDSFDHRSHMIYSGRCPLGYVHVPKLTIHVQYAVVDARGYYLSSDAMAGFTNGRSLHADFWNTWNQAVLQKLVAECLNGPRGPAFCIGMTDAKLARL